MARPVFTDVSAAEERQLNTPAPKAAPAAPAVPLVDTPVSIAPATADPVAATADEPTEVLPPVNVQRQPADSPPLNSLAKDAALSKDMVSIEDAFNEAERKIAAEALKTPEQKEAEVKAAETPVEEPPVNTDQTIKDMEEALKEPGLKARRKNDITRLLTSLKSEKTRAEAAEKARDEVAAKVKEIEAKGTVTAMDTAELTKLREDAQKLADENLKYRRVLSLQDDAEVTAKFDAPVKVAEEGITAVLKNYSLTQPTLDLITKEGGFAAFSKSGKVLSVPVEVDDPDNPGSKKTVRINKTASEISREWLNSMAPADAEAVRESMREQITAQRQKTKYIEEEGAKAKEFYASQRQQATAQTAEQAESVKKISAEYEKLMGETESKTDWLKEQPVTDGMTADAKKAAEEHNTFVKETKTFMRNPVKIDPSDPSSGVRSYQQLVYDAAEARHMRRTKTASDARVKELEAQVARLQGASSTTPKRGSILATPPAASQPKAKKFDPMRDDPTEVLAKAFEESARAG